MTACIIIKETDQSDGGKIVKHMNESGKNHKEDGPAFIQYYESGQVKTEVFYVNAKRHREDGPAYIGHHEDGQIIYEGFL